MRSEKELQENIKRLRYVHTKRETIRGYARGWLEALEWVLEASEEDRKYATEEMPDEDVTGRYVEDSPE